MALSQISTLKLTLKRHNHNTNPIQLFYAFFEHRPMISKLANFVRFSHSSNTVLLPISCLRQVNCDKYPITDRLIDWITKWLIVRPLHGLVV